MAENKYEMLIRPKTVDSNFKVRPQPWYRERLNTKYESKPSLMASSWTFIKDGIDDFRNGVIPKLDSSMIIKGNKGVKPSIFGSDSFDGINPKQAVKKDLGKENAVFTKSLPSQQKRMKRVADVENELLSHPLALYPHIEDSVPPDLFEEIVDLLDPSMTLSNDYFEDVEVESTSAQLQDTREVNKGTSRSYDVCSGYSTAFKNLPKKGFSNQPEEETSKEERNKNNRKKGNTAQLTKIENVTKEFCDWVRDLGGETNNIEECTINNLFASGYDTKPTLSVPVHVVELTSVPAELRADNDDMDNEDEKLGRTKKKPSYTPSWVKVKYGAWYLDPKSWKVREANKPLQDPREMEEKQMSAAKKKSKNLDKTLSNLHGARAFKDFVDDKGGRHPEFLEGVSVVGENTNESSNNTQPTRTKRN